MEAAEDIAAFRARVVFFVALPVAVETAETLRAIALEAAPLKMALAARFLEIARRVVPAPLTVPEMDFAVLLASVPEDARFAAKVLKNALALV